MIRQVAHFCIIVRDLETTEWFYCGILGMEIAFEFRKGEERIGYYLKAGDTTFIEVFRGETRDEPGRIKHFCLETDDLDDIKRRLAEHGIASTEKKLPSDFAWQAWCKDPDGIDIEFHQYTEKSLQFVGGVCRVG